MARLSTFMAVLTWLGGSACARSTARLPSDPSVIQAAAIAFLAHANADPTACVQVASGPNELAGGRVVAQLQDAPPQLIIQLQGQGVAVRAFSACSLDERERVTYAIGWPRETERGILVHADRRCGSSCGEGSLLLVKEVGTKWRATEAETTWLS
jgi:hypothetical protein